MPSRNRSAKACDPASLSPKETASLTDFSDMVYASLYADFFLGFAPAPLYASPFFCTGPFLRRPPWATPEPLRSRGPHVQRPRCKAFDIVAARPRYQRMDEGWRMPERNRFTLNGDFALSICLVA